MPDWQNVLEEMRAVGSPHDVVRRKYMGEIAMLTGRNVIAYYSGWLQKPYLAGRVGFELNDSDKNGFMTTVHGLDRSKGLDLILHTPGGQAAALESLVDYLRAMFGTNIRAIVPQIAMSAGTMLALSCKEILMGKHSNLGPIDPQIGGLAAHAVVEEFNQARGDIALNPAMGAVWMPILQRYTPTLIGECQKAIKWANDMVREYLRSGMFQGEPDADAKASAIVTELGDHALTLSHGRHISAARARDLGIKVISLEDSQELQDAVLSAHHAYVQTLSDTPAFRIVENHNGVAFAQSVQTTLVPGLT